MEKHVRKNYITVHIISLTVFCILITLNILSWSKYGETETAYNFTLLQPYDTTVDNYLDVREQLIDLNNFKFVVNPLRCDRYQEGLLLLIIVTSKPSNFEKRRVIRNTWGRLVHSTVIVFFVGETDNQTNEVINKEIELYRDIVVGNFVDAYRNMTYKHVMGLKWVYHYCPQAKYVLKSDDDTVVNTPELRRFLAREMSPWGAEDLIACNAIKDTVPYREDGSKWAVTVDEYPDEFYPTYCAGWLILYSQDVVRRLLQAAHALPYFWIDDVHITGTCAVYANVPRTDFRRYFRMKWELDLTADELEYFIFGPYDLSVDEMNQIWDTMTRPKYNTSSTTSRPL